MGPRDVMTNSPDNGEIEIDLQKLLFAYLRKWWLIVVCAGVVAAAVLAYTWLRITPLYRASVSLYVNNRAQNQQDYMTSSDLTAAKSLVQTYITITKSDQVMDRAARELGEGYSVDRLQKQVSTSQLNQTEVFAIYVTTPDPEESAKIANVLARVVPEVIASIIEGSSARVVDYAKVPDHRFSPSYTRNTLVGGLVGMVIALAYLTVDFLLDVRIKDEEDLSSLSTYPILGQIPDFNSLGKRHEKGKYGYGYGTKPEDGKEHEKKPADGKEGKTAQARSDKKSKK